RRRFILAAGGAAPGVGSLAYVGKVEPQWLDVNTTALPLPAGLWSGAPLRVLHLSDLHLSRTVPLAFIDQAITRGLAEKPEVICVTGDFITAGHFFDPAAYATVLARLAAAAPTFATLGNHDGGPWTAGFGGLPTPRNVSGMLTRAGLTWLHNQTAALTVRGRRLHLVGMGDWWCGDCRPALAFRNFSPPPDEPVLALSHNPDSKEALKKFPWHVMLSGHTHGGQCGVPLLGPALAPVRDKDFIAGAYRYADRWLYITRGVGNLHGIRLLCRPEVSVLALA
ncbi:MAG: phosphodiesterase YaeI, partial [Undibacterium sp.]|nr:phosphodiesterase YaeI [Opitutaceae bacterium]